MKKSKILSGIIIVLCCFLLFIGLLCFFSARWYINVFGDVGVDSILYTLLADFKGVEMGQVMNYIKKAFLPTVITTLFSCIILFMVTKRKLIVKIGEKIKFRVYPFSRWFSASISIVLSATLIFTAANKVKVTSYLQYMLSRQSSFIEDNYVNPKDVNITFPEQKQNLIIIYLESMETSFLSDEYKGGNDINPMPELLSLAEQNLNFSQNETVGGFSSLVGGTWTIGALVSMTSGVPLKVPFNIDYNTYGQNNFMPGITSLSDILKENGYYQALMVGSDSTYGGRKQYFTQHGVDVVYDLYSARQAGIVYPEYWAWWGIEDLHLFNYAKNVLPSIASQEKPFAFSMLTVDTHHVDGYKCKLCEDKFPEQYENVIACSSKQVYEFVEWLQKQDFYKNTTIIISGDHPTMDAGYISRNITEGYERKVYNCFINAKSTTQNSKNRDFCSLDMFPTTLAAIGCSIEGDRLGLGTNLFSRKPTLCEELGISNLEKKLSRRSEFYNNTFLELDI